jgi:hypothetical protein
MNAVALLLQQGLDVFGLPHGQSALAGGDGQFKCAQNVPFGFGAWID